MKQKSSSFSFRARCRYRLAGGVEESFNVKPCAAETILAQERVTPSCSQPSLLFLPSHLLLPHSPIFASALMSLLPM